MKTSLLIAMTCTLFLTLSFPGLGFADPKSGGGGKGGGSHDHHPKADHPKADTRDPKVNRRQERQHDRIEQGVKSGQLTKEETQQLAETQKEIRQEEAQYKSDGTLTKEERKDLHSDLNVASKEIYQEKHDAETQPGITPNDPSSYGTKSHPGIKDPSINERQQFQKDRIQQGIQSGSLTKPEAYTLAQKEAALARMERRLKEDGTLTAEERLRLQKIQNNLSSSIYKQKHDTQSQDSKSDSK